MNGVCPIYYVFFNGLHIILVGKVALDIICDTAFGYQVNSLQNPENELAVAFDKGANLQDGTFIQIWYSEVIIITAVYSTEYGKIRTGSFNSRFPRSVDKFLDA